MNARPETNPPSAAERRQLRLRHFIEVQRLSPPEQTALADDFEPGPVYDHAPEPRREPA